MSIEAPVPNSFYHKGVSVSQALVITDMSLSPCCFWGSTREVSSSELSLDSDETQLF